MTCKDALEVLLAKVEAGEAKPHEVFNAFDTPCQDFALQQRAEDAKRAYTGSLDAAKALHEAVLPGWEYGYDGSIAWVKMPGLRTSYRHDAMNGHTARAWLIAIIKALIAQEETA